jgi:xanthine dehydrogenase accessory factor
MTGTATNATAGAWAGGARAIIDRMRELRERDLPFATCLVAHTEGSSYRKPGSLAVVPADEAKLGVISGGCLEADLDLQAREALAARAPRRVVFDTLGDDDAILGSGSGCRGRVHVLIVPDLGDSRVLVDALLEADTCHEPLQLVLVLEGPRTGQGWLQLGAARRAIGAAPPALAVLLDSPCGAQAFGLDGARALCARLAMRPAPSLLLVGAGPEAEPLLRIARGLGWHTTIMDHRPAALAPAAAHADRAIGGRPGAAFAGLPDERFDACVVMSHTAASDLEALRALALRGEAYVGLLGPPARRDELLAMLGAEVAARLAGRLRAPVGLRLGGTGPEPLALAIAAELQQYFSGPGSPGPAAPGPGASPSSAPAR